MPTNEIVVPSLTEEHSKLVEKNKEYRAAVAKSAIDRAAIFDDKLNADIDKVLLETGRNYELHAAYLNQVIADPFTVETMENIDGTIALIVCDNGFLIIGDNIDFGIYWNDIVFCIETAEDELVFQLANGGQVMIKDDNAVIILDMLRIMLSNKDLYIPKYVDSILD